MAYWRQDWHFMWSSKPLKGSAFGRAKTIPSFVSYFNTECLAPEIKPTTSYPTSAVKCSTDWDIILYLIQYMYVFTDGKQ